MELLQLHYFRTVAKHAHMTKAAEELHIAQPALSKTIARLEADLGVALFDRSNRQLRLNEFGEAFLRRVDIALAALDEGRRELADLSGLERGLIRLSTTTLTRLSGSIAAFRERYPDIRFRIVQVAPSAADDMVRQLKQGEADLVFTASALLRPGITEQPVVNAEVCLAVPIGHRLASRDAIRLSEAANEKFVEYNAAHPFRRMNDEYCRQAGIERLIACEVDEPSALWSLVQAGLGLAFVPHVFTDDPAIKLLRIEAPECRRIFAIAWNDRRYLSRAAAAFRTFLLDRRGEQDDRQRAHAPRG